MQSPLFPRVLYSNKNVHWTKKYLLISNTDLIQTSLTKANHEIFLHLNFFPPLTLFYLHVLYYLENPGCVLEVSNTWTVVHEKKNESDHSMSMTGYKMLRYNCLLVFPNPHRNLIFPLSRLTEIYGLNDTHAI